MSAPLTLVMDCDNTFGILGCDVDDALALLYLLGCPEANLLGITCTFGNSTLDAVYENTKKLFGSGAVRKSPCFAARPLPRCGAPKPPSSSA